MRGGGIALVGFLGSFGAAIVVGLVLDAVGVDALLTFVLAQVVAWSGLLIACRTAVRRHAGGSLRDLGLHQLSRADVWLGVKSGLALRLGSILIAIVVISAFGSNLGGDPSVSRGIDLDGIAIIGIAIVVIGAPFFEELFFRGLVQGVLIRRWGARKAVFAQAALFAVVHLWPTMSAGQLVLGFSTIMFVGVYQGGLRWRHKRLGPSMASHGVFNLTGVLLFLAVNGTN